MQTLDETAAKELIQQLLGKKYNDMVNEVHKLSGENKEFIKGILNQNQPLFMSRVQLHQILSGHSVQGKKSCFQS